MISNAREFVDELQYKSHSELGRFYDKLDLRAGDGCDVDLSQTMQDAGVLLYLEAWLASNDEKAEQRACEWLSSIHPSEAWMREHVVPLLLESGKAAKPSNASPAAYLALGSQGGDWVIPIILEAMEEQLVQLDDPSGLSSLTWGATALGKLGDPKTIPAMIGMIASDRGDELIYDVGYFGLRRLTGVTYDSSHDGTWWLAWWQWNRARFSAEVQAIPIPSYASKK